MKNFKLLSSESVHFAGDIIVTDPCYFIPQDMWSELCDRWFSESHDPYSPDFADAGVIELEGGGKILYSSTAYGDGVYPVHSSSGKSVHNDSTGVDAGMIAVIKVEDAQALGKLDVNDKSYPRINDFDGDINADGNGNFVGDLFVTTTSETEEEDYDEGDEQLR